MKETIVFIFGTSLTMTLWMAFFLIFRKLMLWYWQINQAVKALENLYELELLLHSKEIQTKRATFLNTSTNQLIEMSIGDYLLGDNRQQYKIS